MSAEVTVVAVFKFLAGAAAAGLLAAWGWIAKNHSDRLKQTEDDLIELNDKLNTEYHDKEAVEKHITLVMAPIQQRLDMINGTMIQAVDELRKLNDRVIRVETKSR
jgi:septal ring factor EnvC (AmiA/AmiB activator)